MEGILYILFVLFVLAGLISAIYYIMLLVLRPRRGERYALVIPLKRGSGEAAERIYAARMRAGLMGDARKCLVVAVDMGMPPNERRMIEELCDETEGLCYCKACELASLLGKLDFRQ